MLKMFTTQLTGLLKRIEEKEEDAFEDAARLLAQALVGDGQIFLFAHGEMEGITAEALSGAEPMKRVRSWDGVSKEITIADRGLIFSRYANDPEAVNAGKWLREQGIPFVAVSTHLGKEDGLVELADVHLDLHLKKPLLPDEDGNRIGYPSSIAALYVYYGLTFTIKEILEDS